MRALLLSLACLATFATARIALRHRDRVDSGRKLLQVASLPMATGQRQAAAGSDRVTIPAGRVHLSAHDWQATGVVEAELIQLDTFDIDRNEVSREAWTPCVRAGRCPTLAPHAPAGLPVTQVSPAEAETYCDWKGGRLPTRQEWSFAAASPDSRGYAWGPTGLVCRRAVWGTLSGPCSTAGRPQATGTHPAGQSQYGAHDLQGNVAEWARDGSRYAAMGGSFRSRLASELRVWSRTYPSERTAYVGFRCVYDADP